MPQELAFAPLLLAALLCGQPLQQSLKLGLHRALPKALVLLAQLVSLALAVFGKVPGEPHHGGGQGSAMGQGEWAATIILLSAVYSAPPPPGAPWTVSAGAGLGRVLVAAGLVASLPTTGTLAPHYGGLLLLYGSGDEFWWQWAARSVLGRVALLGSGSLWWGTCLRALLPTSPSPLSKQHDVDKEELVLLGALLCVALATLSAQPDGQGLLLLCGQAALLGSGAVARFLWAWSRGGLRTASQPA